MSDGPEGVGYWITAFGIAFLGLITWISRTASGARPASEPDTADAARQAERRADRLEGELALRDKLDDCRRQIVQETQTIMEAIRKSQDSSIHDVRKRMDLVERRLSHLEDRDKHPDAR